MTRKVWFFPLIISASILIAYINCLPNEFLWDDEFLVQKNQFITSFSFLPEILTGSSTAGFGGQDNFYRPTQTLYYLIIHSFAGKSPWAFHLGNIFLHIINALLVFYFMIKLFGHRQWAFMTSLLWALHPVHTESISYISATADPMSFLFTLLCLICFPFNKKKGMGYSLSLVFYILALVSKESSIIAPGLIVICIFLTQERTFYWRHYLKSIPFWLTSVAYLLLRDTLLDFNGTYEFYKTGNIYTENVLYRVYTYLATLPEYLGILFWPTDLHMERRFPVFINFFSLPVLLGTTLVAGGLALAYHFRKNKFFSFSWLWFFVAFVPMMGILIPVNSFLLEHWLYLPSLSLFMLFTLLFVKLIEKGHERWAYTGFSIICLLLAYSVHQRNKDWRTPISFYNNILQYHDGTARIHNNLAMAYSEKEDFNKALLHYKTSIQMSDTYPQSHYNIARIYIRMNQFDKALFHLNRSLEINPRFSYSSQLKAQVLEFLKNQKRP